MTKRPSAQSAIIKDLKARPKGDPSFPRADIDYYRRFADLETYLNEQVHPLVNQGAAAHGDGWLTDHGAEHIQTVLRRASDLITTDGGTVLSPYEGFLLASGIHFHDVGNVFGREQHERKITEVMAGLNAAVLGDDGVERRMIRDIAMAHGGYVDVPGCDKDTIGSLRWRAPAGSHEPRVKFLAALLRFADELADDHTRTNRFLLDHELASSSEAYHVYADRLRHVSVRPEDSHVRLDFEFDADHATRKYQKGAQHRVYLYDEIVTRCLKMHREHIYCNRFMQPYVAIDRIDVSVTVTTTDYMQILKEIRFSLAQRGYPDKPVKLRDVVPAAADLTGAKLRKLIQTRAKQYD